MNKSSKAYKRMLYFLSIIFLLSLTNLQFAQKGESGTQSIFNFGFSARAMGLGRAYVALADDPSAVFWNPAVNGELVSASAISFPASGSSTADWGSISHIGFFSAAIV